MRAVRVGLQVVGIAYVVLAVIDFVWHLRTSRRATSLARLIGLLEEERDEALADIERQL